MIKRGVGSGVLVQQQRGANVTLLCSGQVLCIALTTLIPRLLAELQCICVCVGGGRTLSSPGKIVDFIESFTFFTWHVQLIFSTYLRSTFMLGFCALKSLPKTSFNFNFESQIDGIPVVTFHLDAGQLGLVDSRLSLPSTAAPTLILRSLHCTAGDKTQAIHRLQYFCVAV